MNEGMNQQKEEKSHIVFFELLVKSKHIKLSGDKRLSLH